MRDLKTYDGLAPIDVAAVKIIEKRGVSIRGFGNQEWFSYSTGLLLTYNHPEIILCGLSSETEHGVINDIGDAVVSGRKYELDKDYSEFFADDAKCRFQAMHVSWYSEHVLMSQWFYGDDPFPVWQCFWSDNDGYYPWDPTCDLEVVKSQPKLYEPALPIY